MANGLRISQAGIPVDQAADYQKTMDERWPVLEHLFLGIVDIQNLSTDSEGVLNNVAGTIAHVPIYKHNLGYPPAFRIQSISWTGFDTFNSPITDFTFADEKNIYVQVFKSAGAIQISVKALIEVVDRDCSLEFQAPIDIVTSNQTSNPSQYGLKILNNPGARGMAEKDKSLYTYNTNAKSMLIQQHGTRTADSTSLFGLVIQHNLGYPPTFMAARKAVQTGSANPSVGKLTINPMNGFLGLARSDAINLSLRGAQSALAGDYVFIILKDPVDVAR